MPKLPPHGFPSSEFELRTARAQAIMRSSQLDGIFVTTPQNVRYFTGFASQFWESPTRPWFVVVPADGGPIAVIPEIGAAAMADTWMTDIRTWPAPVPQDDGVTLLASVLAALPRRFGKIGAEIGREMALRMPVSDFMKLPALLAGMQIVDGSPAIWQMRMIKTDAEVERIRTACQIACDTYDAVPSLVSRGMTERDAIQAMRLDSTRRGIDAIPFMPGIAGTAGVSQIVVGPSDRRLETGDIFFVDTGMTFDGYFCDFDRNYSVGKPDAACAKAHEAVWQATEVGLKSVRPGLTTEDLWRAMSKVLLRRGCAWQQRRPAGPWSGPAVDGAAFASPGRHDYHSRGNGPHHRTGHGIRARQEYRP